MSEDGSKGPLSVLVNEAPGAFEWHAATSYNGDAYRIACERTVDVKDVTQADTRSLGAIDGLSCPVCRDRSRPEVEIAADGGTEPSGIEHSRECPECGETTFQFERCHECGDVPWKDGEPVTDGGPEACPACGEPPGTIYRCRSCGYDLVETNGDRATSSLDGVLVLLIGLALLGLGYLAWGVVA